MIERTQVFFFFFLKTNETTDTLLSLSFFLSCAIERNLGLARRLKKSQARSKMQNERGYIAETAPGSLMDRPRHFYLHGRRLRTTDGLLRGFAQSPFPSFVVDGSPVAR